MEQKLVLFHLVNDIVQHSAKKGFTELLDKFKSGIKESMPHLKEEKIAYKVTGKHLTSFFGLDQCCGADSSIFGSGVGLLNSVRLQLLNYRIRKNLISFKRAEKGQIRKGLL